MSTKNSQRRSKATPSTTSTEATPSAAVVPAPVPAPTPVPAPEAASESPARGSKRKAASLQAEDVKSSEAAPSATEAPKGKKSKASKEATAETKEATTEIKASKEPKAPKKPKESKAPKEPKQPKESKQPKEPKAPKQPRASKKSDKASDATVAMEVDGVAVAAASTEEATDANPSVGRYLRALLKVKYPESTISKEAIQEVQRLVYQFGLHFLVTVKRHLESARKNTLMLPDMPICLQRVLSASDLYSDFSEAMLEALNRYDASYPKDGSDAKDVAAVVEAVDEKRKQMWAARAGLSIPPTRIKEFAKQYLSDFRFSQSSITGLTALLERLAILVFQLSFEKAQELSRKRISQADVQAAVSGTNNLRWLLISPVLPIV